ncbi:hypothetical protein NIE88_04345 [Sporolactobacillus shoreicorticis]|uniref:Uncharacterized protein n=1 Tax=Sporolactobacillus shoreicorticis TaxID=1923877 RepID=A0ABW5RZP5_9BACL|nr:hypothetical protein [Sporolactobacillus shoreicorticis]MCO7125005.1 hypothetical protein [Sporolactobacillus shoreicorticis]
MISWLVVRFSAIGEAVSGGKGHITGGIGTFFYICAGIGLVLHIIALIKSKKAGISIVGHVLGIVAVHAFGAYMV